MKLLLIRHTSVGVPPGTCYGQTDVPLAPTFPQEAEVVKNQLKNFHFDKVFSSPLSRCVKLAEFCGYPDAEKDARLLELNFGEWEMKAFDEINDPVLAEWFEDYINVRPPGGESVMMQQHRFLNFIDDLKKDTSLDTVALFTHGGILINALVALTGKSFTEVYSSIPPYGSILEFTL